RATRRERRGHRHGDRSADGRAELRYEGLDGVERRTVIDWNRTPSRCDAGAVVFSITLEPQEVTEIEVRIACEVGEPSIEVRFGDALEQAKAALGKHDICKCTVVSSNDTLNRWFSRSAADLHMMLTDTASCVRARWPRSARSRSANTTGVPMRHHSLWRSRRPTSSGRPIANSLIGYG